MTHENKRVRVALHIHTLFSPCAETKLEDIESYCQSKRIDVIAITDHDTIGGAVALQATTSNLRVIVGEEIRSEEGEIIGLFLKTEIEPGLSAVETCKRIKDQGGLVYIPHPFDIFKINRIRKRALAEILPMVDIIEVWNGKANLPIFNQFANQFAEEHQKVKAVGSDAHYLESIELCWNEMEDFADPQEFLKNLRQAHLATGHRYPLRTWWVGIKNILRGEGHVIKRFRKS
jgi:predicted metal-dependent phosphoesterase TrpH